jgi:hypothetical protein
MNQMSDQDVPMISTACPNCGDHDSTKIIYKLYSDLLEGRKIPEDIVPGMTRAKLVSLISPPQIPGKKLLASLHPDFVMALVSIVVMYLLAIRIGELAYNLLPLVVGAIIFIALYLFIRRWLINRYRSALNKREEQLSVIRAKADIWMKLIYCPKDNLVFLPDYSMKMELSCLKGFLNSGMGDQG